MTQFEKLFEKLDDEKMKPDSNINSYGISITTLEEVFFKVAETLEDKDELESPSPILNKQVWAEDSNLDLNSIRLKAGIKLFWL